MVLTNTLTLSQVIWKRLYKTSSGMEKGTLFHIRNVINRRNVTKRCKQDLNAHEDFFLLTVRSHIIASAMKVLGMPSIGSAPASEILSPDVWMLDDTQRASKILGVASNIIEKYVDFKMEFICKDSEIDDIDIDYIHSYACEVMNVGLLNMEFCDASKEGDGDCLIRVWKYLMLLYRASKRTNYAIEAFTLLLQYHISLAPTFAELKWSRFINVHGRPGRNISCDLHMEHLNRIAKTAVDGLGANKTEKAIDRVGKTVGTLTETLDMYDIENHVGEESGAHTSKT